MLPFYLDKKGEMLQEICLYSCSETTSGVRPWYGEWSPHSADQSGPWSFLTDSEKARETYGRNKEGQGEMHKPFQSGKMENVSHRSVDLSGLFLNI